MRSLSNDDIFILEFLIQMLQISQSKPYDIRLLYIYIHTVSWRGVGGFHAWFGIPFE
jgi:hypothetical protein